MAKAEEIQVCGLNLYNKLYHACQDYIKRVDEGIDREKLNFAIKLADGSTKHITFRETANGIEVYGDFEGMPDMLEWSILKEAESDWLPEYQAHFSNVCDGCFDIRGINASEHKCHSWSVFSRKVSDFYMHKGERVNGECQCIQCKPAGKGINDE